MIRVTKFQLHHIVGFDPREPYEDFEFNMRANLSDPTRDLISFIDDKEVIAIAGINHLRPGVGEAWIICSAKVGNKPFEFFKKVKKVIDDLLLDIMGMHRIQMAVLTSSKRNRKWAQKLGFELEGIMQKYDLEGNEHLLYAKVR